MNEYWMEGSMNVGFMFAGFVWTIWWNLDWRRYIKFYGFHGPAYLAWAKVVFRTFFALCSVGTAVELARVLATIGTRPFRFYVRCLLVAGVWFAVIVLMALVVELMRKTSSKRSTPPR